MFSINQKAFVLATVIDRTLISGVSIEYQLTHPMA